MLPTQCPAACSQLGTARVGYMWAAPVLNNPPMPTTARPPSTPHPPPWCSLTPQPVSPSHSFVSVFLPFSFLSIPPTTTPSFPCQSLFVYLCSLLTSLCIFLPCNNLFLFLRDKKKSQPSTPPLPIQGFNRKGKKWEDQQREREKEGRTGGGGVEERERKRKTGSILIAF